MEDKKNLVEEKAAAVEQPDVQEEEVSLVIKLKKPHVFEGTTYNEIDLTPLEKLTTGDLVAINKLVSHTFGRTEMNPEFSLEYACYAAARATNLPVEFFMSLRPGDGLKVKNRVVNFMFS